MNAVIQKMSKMACLDKYLPAMVAVTLNKPPLLQASNSSFTNC